jgi:V8-like Glu-specific endopeptidase
MTPPVTGSRAWPVALAGWKRVAAPATAIATAVVVAAGVALAGYPAAQAAAQRWPASGRTAVSYAGTPAVGALFVVSDGRLRHFCSAAVVRSPKGDLGITAAHCLQGKHLGAHGNVFFAPGYHTGRFPYGRWPVMSALVSRSWRRHRDPDDDVAFFVIGRAGRRVQRLTGAETLVTDARLPEPVQVIGYPDKASRPVTCTAPARVLRRHGLSQLVFRCGGYTGGTSGGPFLARVRKASGTGEVIGVIGGYQQGGNLPGVSYSARFSRSIAALYRRAIS